MNFARTLPGSRNDVIRWAAILVASFAFAATCRGQSAPATQNPDPAIREQLQKYPGLMEELARLSERMKRETQWPGVRGQSRLLPLLPESTMAYAAFPNYGDAARQALNAFRAELLESAVLRDWWHGDARAIAPKVEEYLERFSRIHDYLGEEIVVSGVMAGRGRQFVVLAEVKKPGLKKVLDEMVAESAGKADSGVLILDEKALSTLLVTLKKELLVLVRPDFVVATTDLAALRDFNSRLGRGSGQFATTPFGQRLTSEYRGGLTVLAGADLQTIIRLAPPATKNASGFEQSGFADAKYLVWEHKNIGEQPISATEVSFGNPRRGAAAWLAKPRKLESLDFVSPKATVAVSLAVADPERVFEDIKQMQGASGSVSTAASGFEKALNLSAKDDLLDLLTGEVAVEMDMIAGTQARWRVVLGVKNAEHLQKTLATMLAAVHLGPQPEEEGPVTYYNVRNGKAAMQIAYAIVDGYLVVGSSRDQVAEAVAIHGSGASLGKSEKLRAAIPPGRTAEASALVYQDPMAMAQLQMQRFSPALARTISPASPGVEPAVICFYGDDRTIREETRGGTLDFGVALIAAAVAIPNLLRSRVAADEASAVQSLRTVNTAQVTYASVYPQRGFAPDLATLGTDPRNPTADSEAHAGLLEQSLANASCAGAGWCTKDGYRFSVKGICIQQSCVDYVAVATPVDSNTGTRSFCATSSTVIHYKLSEPLARPVSVAECKTWPPLQ